MVQPARLQLNRRVQFIPSSDRQKSVVMFIVGYLYLSLLCFCVNRDANVIIILQHTAIWAVY